MGKKKILLVKVSGLHSQSVLNDCAEHFMKSVEETGFFIHDDSYEFREVEVDGVYWEDKNGSL